jgi:hypothetical protein
MLWWHTTACGNDGKTKLLMLGTNRYYRNIYPTQLSAYCICKMSVARSEYPIVILGGGFAGAYCARALTVKYKAENIRTTAMVCDQNVMLFHPMLAEVSGTSVSPLVVADDGNNPKGRLRIDAVLDSRSATIADSACR